MQENMAEKKWIYKFSPTSVSAMQYCYLSYIKSDSSRVAINNSIDTSETINKYIKIFK